MMARVTTYTIGEAARTLGVSKEAVRQAIKAGRLTAKLKRTVVPQYRWAISAEAVEDYRVSTSHRLRGLKKRQLAWATQASGLMLSYRSVNKESNPCASIWSSQSTGVFGSVV